MPPGILYQSLTTNIFKLQKITRTSATEVPLARVYPGANWSVYMIEGGRDEMVVGGDAILTWQLRVVVMQRERAARVLAAVAARARLLVVRAHCHTRRNITERSPPVNPYAHLPNRRLMPPHYVQIAGSTSTY